MATVSLTSQMGCQLAGRGQLFPNVEPTRQNAFGDHLLDLRLQSPLSVQLKKESVNRDSHERL